MSEVIPNGKDSRAVVKYINGGLWCRVAERAGVVIEDVSRNKLRFSGEAIVAS